MAFAKLAHQQMLGEEKKVPSLIPQNWHWKNLLKSTSSSKSNFDTRIPREALDFVFIAMKNFTKCAMTHILIYQ